MSRRGAALRLRAQPEFRAHALLDFVAGEHIGGAFFEQLFDVLHMSSLFNFARNFLSASLYFHVTVPIGMFSIAATSRRL